MKHIPQQVSDSINISTLHAAHAHTHTGVYNQINMSNMYLSCNLSAVSAIFLSVISAPLTLQRPSTLIECLQKSFIW